MEHRIMPVVLITNKYDIVELMYEQTGRSLNEIIQVSLRPLRFSN